FLRPVTRPPPRPLFPYTTLFRSDARTPLLIDVRVRSRLSRTAESGNPTVVTAESVSRQELPDHRPGWRGGVTRRNTGARGRPCIKIGRASGRERAQAVELWVLSKN